MHAAVGTPRIPIRKYTPSLGSCWGDNAVLTSDELGGSDVLTRPYGPDLPLVSKCFAGTLLFSATAGGCWIRFALQVSIMSLLLINKCD